jgi:hypothetical protein
MGVSKDDILVMEVGDVFRILQGVNGPLSVILPDDQLGDRSSLV